MISKSDIQFPEPNDEAYMRQGESFITKEKDISNEYEFVKIQNGKVLLKVKTMTDGTSAGMGIKRARRQIAVAPFSRMYNEKLGAPDPGFKQDTQR